jgi:CHAD domain-containing protein
MTLFQQKTEQLAERLAATFDKLPKEPSAKYVHRVRTAVRRLESLVSYMEPQLGRKQKKVLEEMARLRRRAGKVRDLDVQRELLKEIANGSTGADRHALGEALEQKREKQARRLVSTAKKIADAKVISKIRKIAEKAALPAQDPLAEAAIRFGKLATEFPAQASHSATELHNLRIQMKKIRYVAELAEETPERQAFIERVKSAQDSLGSWHDWLELSKTAEKQFRQRMNCPLVVEIRALLAAKQTTAASVARQLFAQRVESPRKHPRSITPTRELARRAG